MNKKMVSLFLSLALFFGLSAPASAGYFSDVSDYAWFADAVTWAVGRGITTGFEDGTFRPQDTCTQAQILTFLWRSEYMPEPTISNPFTDIAPHNYYYKAALWAYEKGLVSGTVFEADIPCTRSMVAIYLWKLSGSPYMPVTEKFQDVPVIVPYAQAAAWAVEKEVTWGISETEFSPNSICRRNEIVTFLYRYDTVCKRADDPVLDVTPPTPGVVLEPEGPESLTIGVSTSKSSSIIGSMYSIQFNLSANVSGGSGGYSYKFEVLQNGTVTESTGWTSTNGISGTLSGNGTCVVEITVKDSSGETANTTVDLLQTTSFGW